MLRPKGLTTNIPWESWIALTVAGAHHPFTRPLHSTLTDTWSHGVVGVLHGQALSIRFSGSLF